MCGDRFQKRPTYLRPKRPSANGWTEDERRKTEGAINFELVAPSRFSFRLPSRPSPKHTGTAALATIPVCVKLARTTSSSRPSSSWPSSRPSSSWQPLQSPERSGHPGRSPGGSVGHTKVFPLSHFVRSGESRTRNQTASDRLVKLKSLTFKAGITTLPPASVPAIRSETPSISKLFSRNNGDSLNRKLRIDREILPCSIRKVPSRVKPV